ncbi:MULTISPECIES: TetR/AcrR family transcriptional regulator [Streptomyces]|jgi:AcrR family transcriptional regulator|uniref:TetR/AcrR family transcriptional regulator n=1 Tax=Streptomyces TaxID=1883 RepID=UPI0033B7E0CC
MAKQPRALRTYEQVLNAAAQEFAQHGYAEANLQRIAERTGMTKGALYGHFPSKRALATALVDHLEAATDHLLGGACAECGPPLDRLRSLLLALAVRIRRDVRVRAALRLVTETARGTAKPPRLMDGVHERALELVLRAQQAGQVDPALPPEPVADLVVVVLFGAHCTDYTRDGGDLPTRLGTLWDILTRALPPTRTAA